jgi:hypothetical protein
MNERENSTLCADSYRGGFFSEVTAARVGAEQTPPKKEF